ncbi:MAG: hypothetical protein ABMA26_14465 [Limisphaerales bacterium]
MMSPPSLHHHRAHARARGKRQNGGRPAQITLAVAVAIARHVAQGMPERAACHLMTPPVNHESFRAARRRNPQIGLVIEQAQAEFLFNALTIIHEDRPGSAGCRWILERRHPEDFARKVVRQTVSG